MTNAKATFSRAMSPSSRWPILRPIRGRRSVKARTAQANQIRGLLGEFGLVIPKGIYQVAQVVPALLAG
jgi:hypothetical protein